LMRADFINDLGNLYKFGVGLTLTPSENIVFK